MMKRVRDWELHGMSGTIPLLIEGTPLVPDLLNFAELSAEICTKLLRAGWLCAIMNSGER